MTHSLLSIIRKKSPLHTVDYFMAILMAIVIGVFVYFRISRQSEWITVAIAVQPGTGWRTNELEPWYASAFKLNDAAFNSFGQKIAEITDVKTFETPQGKVDTIVVVSLKSSSEANRKQYTYNYQPVLVGKPIEILFRRVALNGVVVDINTPYTYIDKTIEIRLLSEFPWKIDVLTTGLTAKDYYGRTTAEILNVLSENAKSYQLTEKSGRQVIILSEDPYRRDVIMTLKIKAMRYNNVLYSSTGSPIKVGSDFQIQFPNVAINWATISRVYDE